MKPKGDSLWIKMFICRNQCIFFCYRFCNSHCLNNLGHEMFNLQCHAIAKPWWLKTSRQNYQCTNFQLKFISRSSYWIKRVEELGRLVLAFIYVYHSRYWVLYFTFSVNISRNCFTYIIPYSSIIITNKTSLLEYYLNYDPLINQ